MLGLRPSFSSKRTAFVAGSLASC